MVSRLITLPAPAVPGFERAAKAFLAAHVAGPGAWAPGTSKKYRETFAALATRLHGPVGEQLASLDTEPGRAALTTAFHDAFGTLAPATYARHLSALRSAARWWREAGWITGDPVSAWARPDAQRQQGNALSRIQIGQLFRLHAPLREKTLWRLLYESAARAEEVLFLDIDDLDLPNKRARVTVKGGAGEWIGWRDGAASLLPRLLAGRSKGPVFLADRRPTRLIPSPDLCPHTGHARLSYRRAAEVFEQMTRPLANPGAPPDVLAGCCGWTLHQLRHSRLVHEAENGADLAALLARSRHASARSLERYIRSRSGMNPLVRNGAADHPAIRRRALAVARS